MRLRIRSLFALLLLLACLMAEHFHRKAFAESAKTPTPNFRVGVILSLTGPTADYGQSMRQGIELAIQDRPELFRHLEFRFEDAVYDPKKALDAFQRLRTIDGVQLMYVWGVTFCKAVAPQAEMHQLPFIAQCVDEETAKGKKYVIRFMPPASDYTQALWGHLRKNGAQRVGIITADNPYIAEYYRTFLLQKLSPEFVSLHDNFPSTQTDFRSTILRLKRSSYDAVGVFLTAGQISSFYRQSRDLGWQGPSFGTNYFESPTEIRNAQGAMDGAVFANPAVRPYFQTRWDNIPSSTGQIGFGALAYEFALLVGELFRELQQRTPEQIISAFRQVKTHTGTATPDYSFKNDPEIGDYFQFPVSVRTIRNGKVVDAL